MAWEKPVPHHKWADEIEEEKRVKDALKDAKRDAKAEDHTKECPLCGKGPVKQIQHPGLAPDDHDQLIDTYQCSKCDSMYRVNCPGSILLDTKGLVVRDDGQ